MPGDNTGGSKKGGRTIQTTLTTSKTKDTEQTREKPTKQKRTHSDVSEESMTEHCELQNIQRDLEEIKVTLHDNLKKSDLESVCEDLVKKSDLKSIVTAIVSDIFVTFKNEFDEKLRERTGYLKSQIDSLVMDNEQLRENIRDKDKQLQDMKQDIQDNAYRATEAIKLANYNEQYSRKNNIRILQYEEKENQDLRTEFVDKVKNDCNVDILPSDIQAIHRIPGKLNEPRPVIVKLFNTETKIKIMKEKKKLTGGVKFFDDITKRNKGLMWRLKQFEEIENVWFFNCSVYGKTANGKTRKYDILENKMEEKVIQQANIRTGFHS